MSLLHFDRCLLRERRSAAMARARYSRKHQLPREYVQSAVHEARLWNNTIVQASIARGRV